MINIELNLKKNYPNYSDRVDRMILLAKEIVDSKDPFEPINEIVPTLDAIDAWILGLITAEMIKDGTIPIRINQGIIR